MNSFAIFRLPHADSCQFIEGESVVIPSLAEIDQQQGFLLAPFKPSDKEPIVLIKGEARMISTLNPQQTSLNSQQTSLNTQLSTLNSHKSYSDTFSIFHQALLNGQFQKIVLARCATEAHDGSITPIALFHQACQLYPRMFVALVSTPQSGTWLTASPEILLEHLPDDRWRTIALAGTMRLRSDKADNEGQHLRWSAKNIQEQRHVSSYIANVLRRFSDDVHEEGPRTIRAAHLVHLRSDFTFTINKECTRVGELLQALHPTPAVCGLPKEEAQRFIIANERTPRHYYSGFMGPFNLPQKPQPSSLTPQQTSLNSQPSTLNSHQTSLNSQPSTLNQTTLNQTTLNSHLYVSLRCMNITDSACHLYAGGGLLRESVEQQEWLETEAKMETMRRLLEMQSKE
jgi:isochorismate synthase